jgi:DNA polymerase-3 subunit gamma/tau
MLLKGLEEVQVAPSPIQAAEMVLVRLAYVADLPAPAELVRSVAAPAVPLQDLGNGATTGSSPLPPLPPMRATVQPTEAQSSGPSAATALRVTAEVPQSRSGPALDPMPQSFAEVVALFEKRREALLRSHLCSDVHLVHFEPGRIEFRPAAGAPRDLANRLGELLREWTGIRWMISVSEAKGEPTLRQQEEERNRDLHNEVASHPLVQAVLEAFPGATITAVRERFAAGEPAADELSPEDPGDEPSIGEEGA